MIKKQFAPLVMVALLSTVPNSFCMEESKQSDHQNDEFLRKDIETSDLPFELDCRILSFGLESIIENPAINPKEIKKFLDSISLVNKNWHIIASDFGWNNHLSGNNLEPKYKIMIRAFWIPQEIMGLDPKILAVFLRSVVSYDYLCKMYGLVTSHGEACHSICRSFGSYKGSCQTHEISEMLDIRESCLQKIDQVKLAIGLLISGANPNLVIIGHGPLLLFVIQNPALHNLIPALLFKGATVNCVDEFKNTALMCAVEYPQVLTILLDYDATGIDLRNSYHQSALDRAVNLSAESSLTLLLDFGAALWQDC